MEGAPCGCALLAEASQETDRAAKACGEEEGLARCAAWRCPRAGHEPGPLAPAEQDAVDEVGRLTGYRATTCPMEAAYRPEVQRAALAKRTRWVATIEPDPPAVLVRAAQAIERGEGELYDFQRRQREQAKTPANLPGPITSPDQFPRRRGIR